MVSFLDDWDYSIPSTAYDHMDNGTHCGILIDVMNWVD